MGLCLATDPGNDIKHNFTKEYVHDHNDNRAQLSLNIIEVVSFDISLANRLIFEIIVFIIEFKFSLSFGPTLKFGELFGTKAADDSLLRSVYLELFNTCSLLNKWYALKVFSILKHFIDGFAINFRKRVFKGNQFLFDSYHARKINQNHGKDKNQS